MHRERLTHLITVLEAVKPEHFNMVIWKDHCGTAGCAVGWSAVDPVFNAQGFRLTSMGTPVFGEETPDSWFHAWKYVNQFFGLDWEAGQHLFNAYSYTDEAEDDRYIAPANVIDRIRVMLASESPT